MQLNMQQPPELKIVLYNSLIQPAENMFHSSPELTNCISIQEFIINKYYNKKKVPVTIVLLTVTGALLTNL